MEKRKIGRPTENKKDDIIKIRCTKEFKNEIKEKAKRNGFKNLSEYVEYLLKNN